MITQACPDCDGYDIDIDMTNVTAESFQVLTDAQEAHRQSHVVRPEVTHIRRQINPNRVRGNGFYTVKLGPTEDGSQTLCGAEPTVEDMSWGETRFAKGLAYVTCEACKKIREHK